MHNIESVLELSVRYGVGPLVEQCCDFLAGAIDTTNGFGILTLADVSAALLPRHCMSVDENEADNYAHMQGGLYMCRTESLRPQKQQGITKRLGICPELT